MSRFSTYLKATAAEMKHVKWPTKSQAVSYTALVIAISAIVALMVAAFDYAFTGVLNSLI